MPLLITDRELKQLQEGIDAAWEQLKTLRDAQPETFEAMGFDAGDMVNAAALVAALRHRMKASPLSLGNYLMVLPLTSDQANWLRDELAMHQLSPHANLIREHLLEAMAGLGS